MASVYVLLNIAASCPHTEQLRPLGRRTNATNPGMLSTETCTLQIRAFCKAREIVSVAPALNQSGRETKRESEHYSASLTRGMQRKHHPVFHVHRSVLETQPHSARSPTEGEGGGGGGCVRAVVVGLGGGGGGGAAGA